MEGPDNNGCLKVLSEKITTYIKQKYLNETNPDQIAKKLVTQMSKEAPEIFKDGSGKTDKELVDEVKNYLEELRKESTNVGIY